MPEKPTPPKTTDPALLSVHAISQMDLMVLIFDPDNRVALVNRAARTALRFSEKRLLGQSHDDLFQPMAGTCADDAADRLTRERSWKSQRVMIRRTGTPVPVQVTYTSMRDPANRLLGTVAVAQAITKNNRLADERRQADKLAAIGMLASGMAHEISNPLTAVSGYAQMGLRHAGDPRSQRYFEKINDATARAQKISDNLLDFARRRPAHYKDTDLNGVVKIALPLAAPLIRQKQITIIQNLKKSLPKIRGDQDQLAQVLLNVLINAVHAMQEEKGGTITIESFANRPTRVIGITVSDTGCGMTEEQITQLFDPFFTTQPPGQGTGLGMTVSHGIIEEHGGAIRIRSTPGEGTQVVLELPIKGAAISPTPRGQ